MRKKTEREIALEWWDKLTPADRHYKQMECGFNRNFNTLTGREVEKIWKENMAKDGKGDC